MTSFPPTKSLMHYRERQYKSDRFDARCEQCKRVIVTTSPSRKYCDRCKVIVQRETNRASYQRNRQAKTNGNVQGRGNQ